MRWAITVPLLALACGTPPRTDQITPVGNAADSGPSSGSTPGATQGHGHPAGTGGAGGDGSSPATSSSSGPAGAGSDGAPILDVFDGDPPPPGTGCTKVDFLFVIDNSSSMADNQQNLIASFPGFIDAIKSTLQAQDYHVMVVDTDATAALYQCNGYTCGADFPPPACCPVPASCNDTLGSGRNESGAGTSCGFQSEPQYITSQDGDLKDEFSCAANVGTHGCANEMVMISMLRALDPSLDGSGGCNEGFLRDDAILVVTVVSDASPDTANIDHAKGTPQSWHDGVVAAKGGNADAVVAVGLFEASDAYEAWVQLFGSHGFLGSSMASDYSPVFLDAVETIDITCNEFMPAG